MMKNLWAFFKHIPTLIKFLAALAGLILAILALKDIIFHGKIPPASPEFTAKLYALNWIAYEPVNFDPKRDIYPTEDEIARDLEALRSVRNLDGIITFGCEKTLASIPKLARQRGFKGVIMGIYNPTDKQAIELAIGESEHVDGYCIGHNHLGILYDLKTLCKTMQYVRKKTGKPVSTTEYLANYEKVANYVNWLFPDAGGTWRKIGKESYIKTPDVLFCKFKGYVEEAKILAGRHDKSVFLKMISFPSGGHPEYTASAQNSFFKMVIDYQGTDINFPRSVGISFFSAFDIAWKTPDEGYDPAEGHVGILKRDHSPKPAANRFWYSPYRGMH